MQIEIINKSYAYDAAGRLKEILDPQVSAQPFVYHYKSNASLVEEITMPSGAKQSKQHDVMGRLTQMAAWDGNNAVVGVR